MTIRNMFFKSNKRSELKIDESYFCFVLSRMDLKEYRSTANKTLVFGILKIYSKVYNCFANYRARHSKNKFC